MLAGFPRSAALTCQWLFVSYANSIKRPCPFTTWCCHETAQTNNLNLTHATPSQLAQHRQPTMLWVEIQQHTAFACIRTLPPSTPVLISMRAVSTVSGSWVVRRASHLVDDTRHLCNLPSKILCRNAGRWAPGVQPRVISLPCPILSMQAHTIPGDQPTT